MLRVVFTGWLPMAMILVAVVPVGMAAAAQPVPARSAPHAPEPAAAAPASRAESAPRRRVLEEIVVTAQKKEETLSDVPISITALTGDFLMDAGIGGIHELARHTPNVHYASNPCCASIFVRGFGTAFQAGAFDPTVSLVLDDFSIPKDVYLSDPLYDIERFEVLRGPQGILFGKNTPAGLFNVTTREPTDDLTALLIGRLGELGTHRVEAAVGGPIGKRVAIRLAALDAKQPEDVRNTKLGVGEPGTEQRAGRLRLALRPLDDLEVLVTAERAVTDAARTFSFQQDGIGEPSAEFLRRYDPRFEDDGRNHRNSQNLPGRTERTTDRLQGNLRHSFGVVGPVRDLGLVVVGGLTGFDADAPVDSDFSPADIIGIPSPSPLLYDQSAVEARVSGLLPSPFLPGEIEFLLGFLWFRSSYDSDFHLRAGADFEEWLVSPGGFEIVSGQPSPVGFASGDLAGAFDTLGLDPEATPGVLEGDGFRSFSKQETAAEAVFGQVSWHLGDHWLVGFGGRVTFERRDARLEFTCFDPGVICTAFDTGDFFLRPDRSETDFSPKVTLQYFPWDELSLFATRAKGFKSGGFNNFITSDEKVEVGPEETVSWEVGAKGSLFGRSLSWGATFFHMDADNLQVQQFLGGVTVVVQNAASALSRGVELDFQWLTPWEPLSIRGAGAWTDAHYTDFPNAPATRSSGALEQDLSGERLPFVPEWHLALTPELRIPLPTEGWPIPLPGGGPLVLTAGLDIVHKSGLFLDVDLDRHAYQPDSTLWNARLRLSTADDSLSIGVGMENLSDADVLQYATDSPVFPGFAVVQETQRYGTLELRCLF